MGENKMVIVMRRDLHMRKGKIAAQAGHACVEAVLAAARRDGLAAKLSEDTWTEEECRRFPLLGWLSEGEKKVCVYVDGEDALMDIDRRLKEAGILSAVICDAGHTEFHGEATLTCLATEPAPDERLDPVTGVLPLF